MPRRKHQPTRDEIRVIRAISNMPGGALQDVWKHGRRVCSDERSNPIPLDAARLADYLEALAIQLHATYAELSEKETRLAELERDIEGARRLFALPRSEP